MRRVWRAGLLGQQPAALGGLEQPLVDVVVVEGAGGDQVVEVAGRLPQLAVALAHRGGGNPAQLLGQGRPRIAVCRGGAGGRKRHRTNRSLRRLAFQPCSQRCRDLGEWGIEVAAADPLVGWPLAWRLGGATT